MKLVLSPRDNINKLELLNVETFCNTAGILVVVFTDGRARSYPTEHLWYWETVIEAGDGRSKPPVVSKGK